MGKRNLPQPFGIDKISFKDCFTAPSVRHFAVLITGWALTVGTHTISQVILTTGLHESEHFINLYRFLSHGKWDSDKVAFVIFKTIVEALLPHQTELVTVVDDTLNNHMGSKICGAGVQHDGSAPKTGKKIGYGLCFVIIGLAVRLPGISSRVFCLPYAARLWWPRKAKVKPKGTDYKTKPDLALELISLTRSWLDSSITLRVVVDGGYSNGTIIKSIPEGVHITGKLRKDAALNCPMEIDHPRGKGRPRKKGKRLPTPQTLFGDSNITRHWLSICLYGKETIVTTYSFKAIWYAASGNEVLSVVLVSDPCGDHPDTVLFDTDLTASDQDIIQRYCRRWSVEITNRETKDLLGSADPQCRSEKSAARAPMMAYWTYSLLVVWFVTQFRMGKDMFLQRAPWYSRKRNITVSDILAAARRSHFTPSISRDHGKQQNLIKNIPARSPRELDFIKRAKL